MCQGYHLVTVLAQQLLCTHALLLQEISHLQAALMQQQVLVVLHAQVLCAHPDRVNSQLNMS
jgi:hypothetical protein